MLVEIKKIGKEDVTVVTSLDVAETFGKEHYHVMEDIQEMQKKVSTPDFSGLFHKGEYKAFVMKNVPKQLAAQK